MAYSKLPSSLIEEFNPGVLYALVSFLAFGWLFHSLLLALPFALLCYDCFSE